ncbi:C40 family peptidase [Companilactobacillus insicii]|uniref:C40 family peptidase n=1 Tax=Companilactobacillus insicii TaxID=1732567 RepID=UPI000F7AC7F8|nr:C40 family peptidase [Companilactobacillus insicii]
MDKKILTTLLISAGIIGGIAVSNPTNVDAATNKVVRTTKVTSIYNESGKLITNRALAANTPWATDKKITIADMGNFYRVATHEYVKVSDVQLQHDNTGTATISYAPQGGIDLWNGYGANKVASGQKLTNGTEWKFSEKVIDSNGDAWYRIGGNQWIDGTYTKITNEVFDQNAANTWDPNFAAIKVNKDTLVYNNDNYGSGSQGSVSAGTLLQVSSTLQESDGIWYELSSGGYIPAGVSTQITSNRAPVSLNGKSKEQTIDDIISVAKSQLGKPYVWNAKGPDSYDCSGLMQYVFRQVTGQNIGSWTVPQETAGTKVSLNQLQRGDLVFWGPAGASYHVALYLGNNQYLNALRPGTNVKIDTISSSFEPSFGVRIFN